MLYIEILSTYSRSDISKPLDGVSHAMAEDTARLPGKFKNLVLSKYLHSNFFYFFLFILLNSLDLM